MRDKFDLMEEVANTFASTYEATLWLRTEEQTLGSSPAQAIKQGRIDEAFEALTNRRK